MKSFFWMGLLATCVAVSAQDLVRKSGIQKSYLDPSVRFQDDLYVASNGHWLATTEIPPDRSNYGALQELEDLSKQRVSAILKDATSAPQPKGSDRQKLADLYRSYMDTARVEKVGLEPLRPQLESIRKISSVGELTTLMGSLTKIGVETPFGFSVDVDRGNSLSYLAGVSQAGLGLPDRDYYLKDDERSEKARSAYLQYATTLLSLSGATKEQSTEAAQRILKLETALARAQWTRVEARDTEKTYHKTPREKIVATFPEILWVDYFSGLGLPDLKELDVQEPSYFTALGNLLRSESLDTWKNYLELRLIDTYSPGLPRSFELAHFELYGKTLAGVPAEKTREKKAVELIAGTGFGFGALGDLAGKIYVEKYFPPEAKARMDRLVGNLLAAYDESLNGLTWMTEATKAKARAKLKQYSTLIGYAAHPRDYATLSIEPDRLLADLIASQQYEYRFHVEKLGQPVDRLEWEMTPQTVNAYYQPTKNQIVFPAAILQPPMFNVEADDAVNYGAIGTVIGHEISHGFDDQGSKYDGQGNLNDWWTEQDRKAFEQLTARLVSQYNAYEPLPGKHLNGALTLGENIADLSGISIAFKAYERSLEGKPSPVIDGFTGEQRFFIGWAQGFHRKYREAELAKRLLTDPHSPSQYRVNGPLSNLESFVRAFDVKPTDKMYKAPADRITIW
jgi:putative endopeptidase